MSTLNYQINQSPNKLLEYTVIAVAVCAFILKPVKNLLKIRYWKTGLINSINRDLRKIYIASERLKIAAQKFDKEKAAAEYETCQKLLRRYRNIYSRLERVHFLNNSQAAEISENTLLNLYSIEGIVRNIAFSDEPKNTDDRYLNEFSSQLSLGSLQA